MYPLNTEKYNIPENFVDFEGAVSMVLITRHVLGKLNRGQKKPDDLPRTGFNIKTTVYVFDVLFKNGVKVLSDKIDETQNLLRLNNAAEAGDTNIKENFKFDNRSIKLMMKIIEEIDPKVFFSEEFQEMKPRLLCSE